MRKKNLFLCFLALCFLVCSLSKSAQASKVSESPTSRRTFSDFCEFYTYRSLVYASSFWDEYDTSFSSTYNDPSVTPVGEDLACIYCSAGYALVHKDDFTLAGLSMILFQYEDSDNRNNMYRCVVGMSSLEYSYPDDRIFLIKNSEYGGFSNAVKEMSAIFLKEISPHLEDENFYRRIKSGETIPAYSGNYDYFFEYHEVSASKEPVGAIFLVARERE